MSSNSTTPPTETTPSVSSPPPSPTTNPTPTTPTTPATPTTPTDTPTTPSTPTSEPPPPTTPSTTSTPPPEPTTSTTSSRTTPPTTPPTTSTPSPTTRSTTSESETVVTEPGTTYTKTETHTLPLPDPTFDPSPSFVQSSAPGIIDPTGKPEGGLSSSEKIAVAVVVPIVAVGLMVLAGIFFWRKRKQRKDAEEQRRKEVEDYGYNPNADPTIPGVATAGTYEMKDDGSSGYRGWGTTTLAGSTGRKASTTMSGGGGIAYSDATSPTRGGTVSETRSGEPLVHDVPPSPEGEILGAMGPSASLNRGGDMRRGPSNASSSYSAAGRSDGSGEGPIGMAYGGAVPNNHYYEQYDNGNPYGDPYVPGPGVQGGPTELGSSPVIRDVTARRNTRIENPAHYPQQTAGISQNF